MEWPGDDPYDGQRYGLKRAHRYFDEARMVGATEGKKEKILERLNKTGNMDAFYREMDLLETEELATEAPVRRFNRISSGRSFRTSRFH